MRWNFFAFFIALVLSGCGTTSIVQERETEVRDTTFVIVPPAIRDTLTAITRPDSTVQATAISGKDTVILVQYFPKEKRVIVYARPDTLRVAYHDTVQIVQNTTIERTPLILEVLTTLFPIVLVIGAIVLILRFVR